MQTRVTVSVIVPMYNAAATIDRCVAALLPMLDRGEVTEIIIVDDCSTDASAAIAAGYPALRLERLAAQSGPGAARNHAAGFASGQYLWFVDSDVVVRDDAARVLSQAFAETSAGAVFGCYDDSPDASNFLSQYKNLVHRYYHLTANESASTFWAGCGAIERDLFLKLGGFAADRYREPSIEDIELGYRILESARSIVLRRDLQAKHLKEWRLWNLVHTDIARRALPWSRLMLERETLTDDLNVRVGERVRALLAWGSVLALSIWAAGFTGVWLPLAVVAGSALANLQLIRFLHAQRGASFALRAFAYHQLYYLYSSAAFGYATLEHVRTRFQERAWVRCTIRKRHR